MFKIQRTNDIIYAESSDGAVRLRYPAKRYKQVRAIIDMAVDACEENDPEISLGDTVSTVEDAARGFDHIAENRKVQAKSKAKKKHPGARRLVNKDGAPAKLGEMVEAAVNSSKDRRILLATMVSRIKDQYGDDELKARNAIRVAAMKSLRFTLADDHIIARKQHIEAVR